MDPEGKELFGVSAGGSISSFGVSFGISATAAFDTNGGFTVVITPEGGVGTPGAAGFAR